MHGSVILIRALIVLMLCAFIEAAPAAGPLRQLSSNPRYFTDGSGKAVYLTGSHVWQNLQDRGTGDPTAAFNWNAYLNFLQDRNHNFIRLWAWELTRNSFSDSDLLNWQPHAWQRTGPGNAKDGKPKFDLTKFNQAYFDRLRSRVSSANDRGIYASIMLFEGFGIGRTPAPWRWDGHPMNQNNNINGINGDTNGNGQGFEIQTWPLPSGVWEIQKAYICKVVDTVNDLDNVLYEVSNESHSGSTQWQYEVIKYLKSYQSGKTKQHPVGMTMQYGVYSDTTPLFDSPADWISPGASSYKDNPPAATGRKVIIIDTDHLWGEGGDGNWVWKSFMRGLNPIFMDGGIQTFPATNDSRNSARNAMGYTLRYAKKINLASMMPQNSLSSTGYALAKPGSEYLVYQPGSGSFSVNLAAGTYAVEWMNARTGVTSAGGNVTSSGGSRSFTPPFSGSAVLYLEAV